MHRASKSVLVELFTRKQEARSPSTMTFAAVTARVSMHAPTEPFIWTRSPVRQSSATTATIASKRAWSRLVSPRPAEALQFGDLNDPQSRVSQAIQQAEQEDVELVQLRVEKETKPRMWFAIPLQRRSKTSYLVKDSRSAPNRTTFTIGGEARNEFDNNDSAPLTERRHFLNLGLAAVGGGIIASPIEKYRPVRSQP